MTGTIRAIPTLYHDCLFRSRLEGRWAVLFDTIGVTWRYEYEGYQLDGIRYLPDFWLPEYLTWVEVKPLAPTMGEFVKATIAAKVNRSAIVITWENFDFQTANQNIHLWHDSDGVFWSEQGCDWLPMRYCGWENARSFRFEHRSNYWPNLDIGNVTYGELPY